MQKAKPGSTRQKSAKLSAAERTAWLFEPGPRTGGERKGKWKATPFWSEFKAELVARYLKYFVLITGRGAYIDGFAGPQWPKNPNHKLWTASRVLRTQPRDHALQKCLTKFFLFELRKRKLIALEKLKAAEDAPKRTIKIIPGDFNANINTLLSGNDIRPKEPTFALLDQHTRQCEWSSVVALAKSKEKLKIELFYFLATGWLSRALHATRDTARLDRWWGDSSWSKLKGQHHSEQAKQLVGKLRDDLGYKYVQPYPIYKSPKVPRVMYYMVHATDHDEAPKLMQRAYNGIHLSDSRFEQLEMKLLSRRTKER